MKAVLLTLLCGTLGVWIRASSNAFWASTPQGVSLPISTFSINTLGAFLIGVVFCLSHEKHLLSPTLSVAVSTGFLGGLTTFSSLCLESVNLISSGKTRTAVAYLSLSLLLGLLGCAAGIRLTRFLTNGI